MRRPANPPVDFRLVDDLNAQVAGDFTRDAAVTPAHDEHPLRRFLRYAFDSVLLQIHNTCSACAHFSCTFIKGTGWNTGHHMLFQNTHKHANRSADM